MKRTSLLLLSLALSSLALAQTKKGEPLYTLAYNGLGSKGHLGPARLYRGTTPVAPSTRVPRGTQLRVVVANINRFRYTMDVSAAKVEPIKPQGYDDLLAALTIQTKKLSGSTEKPAAASGSPSVQDGKATADKSAVKASALESKVAGLTAMVQMSKKVASRSATKKSGFVQKRADVAKGGLKAHADNVRFNALTREIDTAAAEAGTASEAVRLNEIKKKGTEFLVAFYSKEAVENVQVEYLQNELRAIAKALDDEEMDFKSKSEDIDSKIRSRVEALNRKLDEAKSVSGEISKLGGIEASIAAEIDNLGPLGSVPSEVGPEPWLSVEAKNEIVKLRESVQSDLDKVLGTKGSKPGDLKLRLAQDIKSLGDLPDTMTANGATLKELQKSLAEALRQRIKALDGFESRLNGLLPQVKSLLPEQFDLLDEITAHKEEIEALGGNELASAYDRVNGTIRALVAILSGPGDAGLNAKAIQTFRELYFALKRHDGKPPTEDELRAALLNYMRQPLENDTLKSDNDPLNPGKDSAEAVRLLESFGAQGILGEMDRIEKARLDSAEIEKNLDSYVEATSKIGPALAQIKELGESKTSLGDSVRRAVALIDDINRQELELVSSTALNQDQDQTDISATVTEIATKDKYEGEPFAVSIADKFSLRPILSAGFVYDKLVDRKYRIDSTSAVPPFTGVIRDVTGTRGKIATAAFAHFPLSDSPTPVAFSFGIGLTTDGTSTVHYYPGVSYLFGRNHGFVLTGGLSLGTRSQLVGAHKGDYTTITDSANLPTEQRFSSAPFISIGLRF